MFLIDRPGPGWIAMMPRPEGRDRLPGELAGLRAGGVDTLVCALTEPERERLGLADLPAAAESAGLSYVGFPIVDFGVPDVDSICVLAGRLAAEIESGRFVVVHCFGGVGRSGTIVGAVLIRLGSTADAAIELMTRARGVHAPETEAQHALLHALAEHFADPGADSRDR